MEPSHADAAGGETPRRARAETVFVAVTLAMYMAITAWTAWHHEPWRDEADPWLLARDASLAELFQRTANVGNPALWYLLLMPLAKAGLPYGAMHALHLVIAWAAAAVWLVRAPFPKLTRALVVLSYFLLCEYAVVARNYAPAMLLLFVIAALWRQRFARPLAFAAAVALLANTNTQAIWIAGAVGALYVWDLLRGYPTDGSARRRALGAAGLMLAGGLLAAAQLVSPHDPPQLAGWLTLRHPHAPAMVAALLFTTPSWLAARVGDLRWLAAAALLALTAGWLARPRVLFLALAPAAGMFYVFLFKWIMGARHVGMVLLVVLFALWVERQERGPAPAWSRAASRLGVVLLHLGLVASTLAAGEFVRLEHRYPYSHAAQMADFLVTSGLAGRPLAATVIAQSVLAHLPPRRFYYADVERYGSYRRWDALEERRFECPLEEVAASARRELGDRPGWLLLVERPLADPVREGLRPLAATRGPTGPSGERFYLYEALPGSR